MALPNVAREILERVKQLEVELKTGLTAVEEWQLNAESVVLFFRDGLRSHRDRMLRETRVTHRERVLANWRERVRSDLELRSLHRKMIDVLSGQFDFGVGEFRELQFSKLVKAARMGKNRA